MDSHNPQPNPMPHLSAFGANAEKWAALLEELNQINVKLEYLRLLLKVGVRRV